MTAPRRLAAALLWALAAAAPANASQPRIAVEPESFDFGAARQNRTLTKEFQIRNFGTAELVIGRITTSCGCTVSQMGDDDKRIAPGHSSPLRVSLDTRRDEGRVARRVLIESNDPERSRVIVVVSATIVRE